MILDYPGIGEKELLYVYILRYHRYCGNQFVADSFSEFYSKSGNLNSVLFPKLLYPCLNELGIGLDEYIRDHSALSFYKMFLTKEKYKDISEKMYLTDEQYTIQLLESREFGAKIKSDRLWYCPVCHQQMHGYQDLRTFHQIQGVHVCPDHQCYLNSIELRPYQRLGKPENWDVTVKMCSEPFLMALAEDVSYIMAHPMDMNVKELRETLRRKAGDMGALVRGHWFDSANQQYRACYDMLPIEYQKYKTHASFQRYAAVRCPKSIYSVEYLIFIRFLFGSFQKFIDYYFMGR